MQNCCRWILWQWPKLLSEVERSLRPCSQCHELSDWNEKCHCFLVHWRRNVMNLPQFVEFETSSPLENRGAEDEKSLFGCSFSFHGMNTRNLFFKAELKLTQNLGNFPAKTSIFTWGTHWISRFFSEDLKYCMFGLGDSHYWGKGTEDGPGQLEFIWI